MIVSAQLVDKMWFKTQTLSHVAVCLQSPLAACLFFKTQNILLSCCLFAFDKIKYLEKSNINSCLFKDI